MLEYLRLFTIFGALLVGSATVTACNTISGAGEDVESAGDYIEDSAERNKGY